jgi:hypothetical protein
VALAAAFAVALTAAHAQGRDSGRPMPETEIVVEGGQSFGNIHVFAYADDRTINPYGVEFDRHSWGGLLTARVDYVAEFLPVVLLNEPAKYGADSEPLTTARQIQYGTGFSPAGVRLLWRRDHAIKPYLIGKGGAIYFKNRVLSTEGSHLNFSAQFGAGIETRITRRADLRIGYSDFHISNGDIVARNPGIDFMYANAALAFHFGR